MNPLLINLARDRFANQRPAIRVAILLWLLAAGALAVNGWLYREYFQGSGLRGRRLAEIETGLRSEAQTIASKRARLGSLDLAQQNAVVEFLNDKIDQRTFSWSRLFDRISAVLPTDVRLVTLAPEQQEKKAGRSASGRKSEPQSDHLEAVLLGMTGVAKTDEALSEFQDRLFAHPSFRNVNLTRESRQEGDFISFTLAVDYLPRATGSDQEPATAVVTDPTPVVGQEEEK